MLIALLSLMTFYHMRTLHNVPFSGRHRHASAVAIARHGINLAPSYADVHAQLAFDCFLTLHPASSRAGVNIADNCRLGTTSIVFQSSDHSSESIS